MNRSKINSICKLILLFNMLWLSLINTASAKEKPHHSLKVKHITSTQRVKKHQKTASSRHDKNRPNKKNQRKAKVVTNDYATVILAAKAYTQGDMIALAKLQQQQPNNLTIHYLLSRANLSQNKPSMAQQFIHTIHAKSYLKVDLIHKLMNYYLTQDDYPNFINLAHLLNAKELSVSEACTYNYIKTISGQKHQQLLAINLHHINLNNPIASCALLGGAKFEQGSLSKNDMNIILANLALTKQYSIFNDLAKKFNLTSLDFKKYLTTPINQLPQNKFLYISRIGQIAHKNPEQAFHEIQAKTVDKVTFAIIYNHIAMEYARNHQFNDANAIFSQYKNNYLSDQEHEWYLRTLLYYSNWPALIKAINATPIAIKDKDVWKYWLAQAYIKTHKTTIARKILRTIHNNYSYYSMLALNELHQNIHITKANNHLTQLPAPLNNSSVTALDLYTIGFDKHLGILKTLGSRSWTYLIEHASNAHLLRMSNLARNKVAYDLSIKAGLQMINYYVNLIYPMPFLEVYIKYSKLLAIDPAYALAITRQESRFNHKVIAFDGGVGLMQIMPQTSQYIAGKLKQNDCYDETYQCNILFGSWYLSNLYTKFPNIIYATAAYNAGPSRARKWQNTLGDLDNKIQIELIPFNITRHYVQNVLANKAIYAALLKHQKTINFAQYINSIKKIHYLDIADDDHTDSNKLTK